MKELINIFKALSDPTRLRIFNLLVFSGCGELCICELIDALKLAQYNVSRHMKELKLANLVKEKREGRFIFYSLADEKDKITQLAAKMLTSLPAGYFKEDEARLKARLKLRICAPKQVCKC
jgi:ArsR family transcriptional regulator, arsenate/arsenite/antimonite-responsive transcriptional repressor